MIEDHDVLDVIKHDLNIEPSASFAAGVRRRIDSRPDHSSFRGRMLFAAAGLAVLLVLVAVWHVRRPAPAVAGISADLGARPLPQASPIGVTAPELSTSVLPRRVSSRARGSVSTSSDLAERQQPAFDPFRDVLLSELEQNGLRLLLNYRAAEKLPRGLTPLPVTEPIQIVALGPPVPIDVSPLRVGEVEALTNQ